jgi:hypothetical protein
MSLFSEETTPAFLVELWSQQHFVTISCLKETVIPVIPKAL